MTRRTLILIFWIALLAAVALYVTMAAWSLPHISEMADGLRPFDMRPMGYSAEETQEFLSALSADGRTFYHHVQHRFDLAYPALLALVLALGSVLLAPPGWKQWTWLLAVLPIVAMVFDYRENWLVARLLDEALPLQDMALAQAASTATLLKSLATTAAMTLLLVLLIAAVLRWRRGPS